MLRDFGPYGKTFTDFCKKSRKNPVTWLTGANELNMVHWAPKAVSHWSQDGPPTYEAYCNRAERHGHCGILIFNLKKNHTMHG